MAVDQFSGYTQPLRGVEQSAAVLKRLYLIEREMMRALGGWHISIADWGLKTSIPRDWWQDSLHADALRSRVLELRYPRRDVDQDHDPGLVTFLAELPRAKTDSEFALGVFGVLKPALVAAYQLYLDSGDPLDDAPSFYPIGHALAEEKQRLAEMAPVIANLSEAERAAAQSWVEYLDTYLTAIGGVLGNGPRSEPPVDHPAAGRPAYVVPDRCVRDPRFLPAMVESPTRPPKSVRERQVWLAIDHANEVWAAEVPGALMWAWPHMPWQFFLDVARWGYDEMRHALMGQRRLAAWGFEMGIDYPMVGDPYHAVLEKGGDLFDVLALLYYFERDAPAHRQVIKREYDAFGDEATAQDIDYDWADEAIHLRYGYTWLTHILGADAKAKLPEVVERAGEMWNTWLAERWERGEDGYGPYMERIDAVIAAAEAKAAVGAGT